MSLLDDVSIVVTPNGYKAGELYAVVPVPTEGAELVTNGDFATDTDWSKGANWTISGGSATSDGTDATSNLSQTVTSFTDKRFVVDGVASNVTQGFAYISLGGSDLQIVVNSNGAFKHYVTISSGNSTLFISARNNFIGSIDNVSVKEYTSADMDVTRATAATRVDEDGLVNYAEVVTGSDIVTDGDFPDGSTAWALNGWTISGNTANGNGLTANLIQSISGSANKNFSLTFTISNYISGSVIPAFVGNSSDSLVYSSNGTFTEVISSGSDIRFVFYGASFSGSISNVSLKEVTRDNVPRIDYTGGGCPHILAEPQRTNLITYSEDFTQWSSKINIDVTLNSETSPDGVVNATFINENNSNAQHFIGQSLSITNGQDISISVYAKKNQRDVLQISPSGNYLSTSGYANYDLNNGLVTASGGGVTAEIEGLTNGWFRCVAKFTANNTASGTTAFFLQNSTTASRGSSYDGDGTSGLYMWGAQTEIGSYPTSYIKTSGSTVTRNQDIFTRDGIGSLINSTEGVLFLEMAALNSDTNSVIISINDGSLSNSVAIYYYSNVNNVIANIFSGGNTLSFIGTIPSSGTKYDFNKIALKYKSGDSALWVNGIEVFTLGDSISLTGLNEISFDYGNGSFPFYGKVRQLQVYNTALTDAQLTSLTS